MGVCELDLTDILCYTESVGGGCVGEYWWEWWHWRWCGCIQWCGCVQVIYWSNRKQQCWCDDVSGGCHVIPVLFTHCISCRHCTETVIRICCLVNQGGLRFSRVLEKIFSRTCKVFENQIRYWMFWNLVEGGIESIWISVFQKHYDWLWCQSYFYIYARIVYCDVVKYHRNRSRNGT